MGAYDNDVPPPSLARSLVFLAVTVMGVVLVIALFLAPSASATGGCGGG
jgi:hypothetical protein